MRNNSGNGHTAGAGEMGPPQSTAAVLDAPAERVGLLLADVRTRRGLSLEAVSGRLGGALAPGELMALESGALAVDSALFGELADVYGVSGEDLVPPRDHLVVDLVDRYMRAGNDIALLDSGVGRHDVLSRYLEMIWELRAVDPGSMVTLRDADMEVLGSSLEDSATRVRSDLEAIMVTGTQKRARPGRTRVLVGLGVAIAVVTGSALLVTSNGPVDASPAAGSGVLPPNPEVSIGEAAVLERGGVQGPVVDPLPAAPVAEVGDAAVLERNPDGTPGTQQIR